MDLINASQSASKWNEALTHMREALVILDDSQAPPDVGSQLDLAVCRLEDVLRGKPPAILIEQLRAEMARLLDRADVGEPA